jgi:CYTH domain-containing protein
MANPSREIERKFLVADPPPDLEKFPRKKLRQGYVAVTEGGTELRVRKEGKRHVLTIKEGHGEDRGEHEVEIASSQFAALWPLTKGRRIRKVRYDVPRDGLTIQVDVYRGKLRGLVTAEVEFPDEDAARRFDPREWFGREVTGDDQFSNQNLARNGLPQEVGRGPGSSG